MNLRSCCRAGSGRAGFGIVVCLAGVLFWQPRASAVLPLPTYPLCGSIPDEDDANCPADFHEDWRYLSYIKDEYRNRVRRDEWAIGSGFWLDKAFGLETGDYAVTIAVLDSGIQWEKEDLVNKHRLNPAELPLPKRADGSTSSVHDLNGDGIFNIRDYAGDARVTITDGEDVADGLLDPSDLIAVFSDRIDQDGNGYVDDISGWDFFWNDNNPYDTVRYGHGTGEAEDSAAEGGNGDNIGTCPNCSILNLRVGDSFVTEVSTFAEAVVYAADNGASVIQEALGSLNNSSFTIDALNYAYEKGITVVASAADETSIHQNQPANNEGTLVVHAIRYDGESEDSSRTFLAFGNCTNFGGHLDLSISGTSCSSEATGRGAGLVGLIYSAALHKGITLSPNEVRQLLIQTVDDIDVKETYDDGRRMWYPSQPGWDRYFGYGRPNIYRAVDLVLTDRIPPEADLSSPEWFQVLDPSRTPVVSLEGTLAAKRSTSYTFFVEYGIGLDPLNEAFKILNQGARATPFKGTLATFDLRTLPKEALDPASSIEPLAMDDTNVDRFEKVNRYTVTVRVRVIDAEGRKAEARRTLYVHEDPDLLEAYPLYLAASLEASPKLFDLNGDGRDELIQATADGVVLALQADGTNLPGWPVQTRRLRSLDPAVAGNHLEAPAFRSGAVRADRGQGILATPAIGDLDGDGLVEVVAATYDGEVYAWRNDGTLLPGFPASLDYGMATDAHTSPDNFLEAGFFGSPALADLDGDGYLDIVAGGMDQWVYAWDHTGAPLVGWPVYARYTGASESEVHQDRIMTSPAVGDLDGDGSLEVVIGTNEIVDEQHSPTYAIHGEGNLHPGGPFVAGWPVLTQGLYGDVLPVVGKGTCSSPVLADIDGDGTLEVATHTVVGYPSPEYPSIFRHDGRPFSWMRHGRRDYGALTNTDEPMGFVTINTGSFGDIDQDGDLDYALSLGGLRAVVNLAVGAKRVEHNYLMGAWDAISGHPLNGFPQQVPDLQFFMNPAIADVDGDGLPEVMSGSGGFTVDGFDRDGAQPEGWPKFTGQWNSASPAVGDMDGDGLLEVVQPTRSGWIFAWHTSGFTRARGGVVEWSSFHHDPHNTGNYQEPLEGPGFTAQPGHPHRAKQRSASSSLDSRRSRP